VSEAFLLDQGIDEGGDEAPRGRAAAERAERPAHDRRCDGAEKQRQGAAQWQVGAAPPGPRQPLRPEVLGRTPVQRGGHGHAGERAGDEGERVDDRTPAAPVVAPHADGGGAGAATRGDRTVLMASVISCRGRPRTPR
jgi:hypothetical protein